MSIARLSDPGPMLRRLHRRVCYGLLLVWAYGCAPVSTVQEMPRSTVPTGATTAEQPRWWYVRFRLDGPHDGQVDSYLDGLIADRILAATIERHEAELTLWRFHRRWPDDATGHQFSFIFFAPTVLATRLIAEVEAEPLLQQLEEDGHLVQFYSTEAPPERAADPAGTSDPIWSPEIQHEWPKFIMGASRMWLGLVQAEAAKHPELPLHDRYRAVERALDAVWLKEGNHAFFHHLSGLFGYKPVRVIRRDVMTF